MRTAGGGAVLVVGNRDAIAVVVVTVEKAVVVVVVVVDLVVVIVVMIAHEVHISIKFRLQRPSGANWAILYVIIQSTSSIRNSASFGFVGWL